MKRIVVFLFIMIGLNLSAQEGSSKLSGPYFGQKPPGMTPEIFAPGIVSTNGFEHSKIAFTNDGSGFYWAAQPDIKGANLLQQKIWFVKMNSTGWSKPEQLQITQIGVASPTVFPLSDEIYFSGSGDVNVSDPHKLKDELYKIDKEHKSVKNISGLLTMLTNSWSFSFSKNGNLYFDLKEDEQKPYEIYFSEYINGTYTKPQKMNNSINNGSNNAHPFISSDESFILFSSFRLGGQGIADLYISFRDKNGKWGDAINMGAEINSEILERFPSLSADGKYLFFTRNKGVEISDFYWVDAKIIIELKQKNL